MVSRIFTDETQSTIEVDEKQQTGNTETKENSSIHDNRRQGKAPKESKN